MEAGTSFSSEDQLVPVQLYMLKLQIPTFPRPKSDIPLKLEGKIKKHENILEKTTVTGL